MVTEIPNLVKRNGIYYFRCRIPSILTNGRAREVKISLKTGNLTSRLFDVIVKVSDYSRGIIAEYLKQYKPQGGKNMNFVVQMRTQINQYIEDCLIAQEMGNSEYGVTCSKAKIEGRNIMLNICNIVENALNNGDVPQWATPTIDSLFKGINMPEQYRNFAGQEFLKGFLYCARVQRERLEGKRYLTIYSNEDFSRTLGVNYPSAQAIMDSEKYDSLGDLIKTYLEIPHGNHAKYNADIVKSLELLSEWFGNEKDIRQLSRRDMRNFRDNILRKLPVNRNVNPALRNMTLTEQLADTVHKKISIQSVNHYIARLSGFFTWCVDGEYIVANPLSKMKIASTSKASEERETYSSQELEKIITNLLPQNLCAWAPYKFWIPLIMLYCGCRQNEVCQLFVSDIVEVDGVLCFSFNENEETGARVKNSNSIRTTPIHPVLLQMGFLDYVVQQIENAKSDTRKIQLWPEFTYDEINGYARRFRRFFERFNRNYITKNTKRSCYSLRHNFIDNLKQNEVHENIVSEIVGHANSNITYRRYGKNLKTTVKLEAMKKLDFGFNIFDITGVSPKSDTEIAAASAFIQQSNSAST